MKPGTRSFYAEALQRVIEHVHGHLDEALDLQTLASNACLSPFHFHRVFHGMVGETPMELVRRLRLERAAWQLSQSGDRPVTMIAFAAGYETHEAFTRAFRAHFATSPSDFRRRAAPRIELAATCGVHFDPSGRVGAFVPYSSGAGTMEVVIRELPELRAATVRHIGPYNQIHHAFGTLGMIAGPAGLFQMPGAGAIAMYYDDPESTPSQELRSDAAIVVAEGVELPRSLVEQRVPAGTYACAVYTGPYERIGDTWLRFMGEWLPSSGHRIGAGASYEYYLNDARVTPKEELETEIRVPVE